MPRCSPKARQSSGGCTNLKHNMCRATIADKNGLAKILQAICTPQALDHTVYTVLNWLGVQVQTKLWLFQLSLWSAGTAAVRSMTIASILTIWIPRLCIIACQLCAGPQPAAATAVAVFCMQQPRDQLLGSSGLMYFSCRAHGRALQALVDQHSITLQHVATWAKNISQGTCFWNEVLVFRPKKSVKNPEGSKTCQDGKLEQRQDRCHIHGQTMAWNLYSQILHFSKDQQ